jgi:hypothetical protein
MPLEFQFDEKSHTYRVKGVIVPGVTRVIDHAGLTDYDNVRADILERKSALGKVVHRCIHFWNQRDLDWSTVDERAKGYVESCIQLSDDLKLVPRKVECQCIAELNGMLYGMQVDWEGLVGPDEALIDYKITCQAQPHHAIQLAGYALGLPHEKLTSPAARFLARKRFTAKLHEGGKRARLIPYESKNDAKVFESALMISHWKLLMGKKIEPIELEEAA